MWLSLAWGWVKSNCSLKTPIKFFLTFVRNFTAVALHGRAGEKKVPSIFSQHDNRETSVSLQQVSRFSSHQFQFLSYRPGHLNDCARGAFDPVIWWHAQPLVFYWVWDSVPLWDIRNTVRMSGPSFKVSKEPPALRSFQVSLSCQDLYYIFPLQKTCSNIKKGHAHYWLFEKHAPQRLLKFFQEQNIFLNVP